MNLFRLVLIGALAAGAGTFAAPRDAAAQGNPNDPVKDVARQRFQDGVKAYDAGRYEEARTAFEQAYTLSQSSAVLLNLGMSEAKTNRCVVGGNHLIKFLRDHKEATAEQKAAATAAIEDCKKKAAVVSVTVDAPGADVTLDGAAIGKSPLPDPIFVEPGTHSVIASLNGKTASASVDAKKGQTAVATVTVNVGPPPGPGPGPEPGPAPVIGQPGPNPDPQPAPNLPPNNQPPDTGGREDFGTWVTSSPLFWVGSGLTVVGLGLGIGFSVAASSSKSDVETIASEISRAGNDQGEDPPYCNEDSSGAGDVFPAQCTALRDALGVHDANVAVAVVGYVVAGLAAGGTIAYVMIDWYGGEKKSKTSDAATVIPVPIISPDMQGMALMGRF